jgi:hypothetical protein
MDSIFIGYFFDKIDRINRIIKIYFSNFPATGQQGLWPEGMEMRKPNPPDGGGDWVLALSCGERQKNIL